METAGRLSGMVIQAFRELGKDHITPKRIAHLRRTIPAPKRREILADLRLAPTWMHPLFRSLAAARADSRLYECLSLIDSLRGGRARERTLAKEHLTRLIDG